MACSTTGLVGVDVVDAEEGTSQLSSAPAPPNVPPLPVNTSGAADTL